MKNRVKARKNLDRSLRRLGGHNLFAQDYKAIVSAYQQGLSPPGGMEWNGTGIRKESWEDMGNLYVWSEEYFMLEKKYPYLDTMYVMQREDGYTYAMKKHAMERLSERRGHHSIERTILYMIAAGDERMLGTVEHQAFMLTIDGSFMGFAFPLALTYVFNTFYLPEYLDRFPEIRDLYNQNFSY